MKDEWLGSKYHFINFKRKGISLFLFSYHGGERNEIMPSQGYLTAHVFTSDAMIPVENAQLPLLKHHRKELLSYLQYGLLMKVVEPQRLPLIHLK